MVSVNLVVGSVTKELLMSLANITRNREHDPNLLT